MADTELTKAIAIGRILHSLENTLVQRMASLYLARLLDMGQSEFWDELAVLADPSTEGMGVTPGDAIATVLLGAVDAMVDSFVEPSQSDDLPDNDDA